MSDVVELISKPGFYPDISEDRYHADCVIEPSLSSSIAKKLVHRSARHAWTDHPRLNPAKAEEAREPTRPMDIGTAAHKVILGRGADIVVIPFDDYRKKDAQAARDHARATGKVPILSDDMREVERLREAAMDQLSTSDLRGYFEAPGQSELTMVWREHKGVWCRGRIDRLPDHCREEPFPVIADLKTTASSSHYADWERTAYDLAYDIQSVMYPRGLRALCPAVRQPTFKFAVLEQAPPYGLSVVEFPGLALGEAEEDVKIAIDLWAACLGRGTARQHWPSYDGFTQVLDKPAWRSDRAEIRRRALQDMLMRWQSPLNLDNANAA